MNFNNFEYPFEPILDIEVRPYDSRVSQDSSLQKAFLCWFFLQELQV